MDSSPVFDLYDFIAEPDTAVYATAMPSNSSHHSYHNGANGANIGDTPVASFNGVRDGLYSQSSIPSSHPTAADGSRYHHPHHLQINQPSVSPFYLHHMQNVSYIDNAQLLNQSPYTPPTNRLVDSPFIHHENGAFRPTSSFNTLPASSVPSSSSFVAHHPHNDGNPINFSFSTNNTPTPNITTTNTITNTVVPLITNVPSGYHPQDHQPMQGQEALDVVDHHHQVKHETLGNKTCGRGAENSPSTTVSHSKKDQLMGRKCRIRFDFRDPLLSSVYQFLENNLIFYNVQFEIMPILKHCALGPRSLWAHFNKAWWGARYEFTFGASDAQCLYNLRQRCTAMVLVWNELQVRYFNSANVVADDDIAGFAKDFYYTLQRRCQQNRSQRRKDELKMDPSVIQKSKGRQKKRSSKTPAFGQTDLVKKSLSTSVTPPPRPSSSKLTSLSSSSPLPVMSLRPMIDSRTSMAELLQLTSTATTSIFNKAIHQLELTDKNGCAHFNLNAFHQPLQHLINHLPGTIEID